MVARKTYLHLSQYPFQDNGPMLRALSLPIDSRIPLETKYLRYGVSNPIGHYHLNTENQSPGHRPPIAVSIWGDILTSFHSFRRGRLE